MSSVNRKCTVLGILPLLLSGGSALANECLDASKVYWEAVTLGADEVGYEESLPLFRSCLATQRSQPLDQILMAQALYETGRYEEAIHTLDVLLAGLLQQGVAPGEEYFAARAEYLKLKCNMRMAWQISPEEIRPVLWRVQEASLRTGDLATRLDAMVYEAYVVRLQKDVRAGNQQAKDLLQKVLTEAVGPDLSKTPPYELVDATVRALRELQIITRVDPEPPAACLVSGETASGELSCIRRALALAREAGDPGLIRWAEGEYQFQAFTNVRAPSAHEFKGSLEYWWKEYNTRAGLLKQRRNARLQNELVKAAVRVSEAVLLTHSALPRDHKLSLEKEFEITRAVLDIKDASEGAARAQEWLEAEVATDGYLEASRQVLLALSLTRQAEDIAHSDLLRTRRYVHQAEGLLNQIPKLDDTLARSIAERPSVQIDPMYLVIAETTRGRLLQLQATLNPEQNRYYSRWATRSYSTVLDAFLKPDQTATYLQSKRWLLQLQEETKSRMSRLPG